MGVSENLEEPWSSEYIQQHKIEDTGVSDRIQDGVAIVAPPDARLMLFQHPAECRIIERFDAFSWDGRAEGEIARFLRLHLPAENSASNG